MCSRQRLLITLISRLHLQHLIVTVNFTAHRIWNAYAYSALCETNGSVSVRLSVTSRYSSEAAKWIKLVYGIEATPRRTPQWVVREFGYLQKQGYIRLELFHLTLHLIDFLLILHAVCGHCKCSQLSSTVISLLQCAPPFVYNTLVVNAERRAVLCVLSLYVQRLRVISAPFRVQSKITP